MAYTPIYKLLTGLADWAGWPISMWNRMSSVIDGQIGPLSIKLFGNGIYYGGVLNMDGTVGPTRAFVDGCYIEMLGTNNAVTGLTAGVTNYIWLTATLDLLDPDSAANNVGSLTATMGNRPDNNASVFLGVMVLNGGGTVTSVNRWAFGAPDTTKHGAEYLFPMMMRCDTGTVSVGTVANGATAQVVIPSSEGWYFRVPGAVVISGLPAGWTYTVADNSEPDKFTVAFYNGSGYTEAAPNLTWLRWGLIRPAWSGGIWGRESYPWPGSGGILPIE